MQQNEQVAYIGAGARTARQLAEASAALNPEQSSRANARFVQIVRSFMIDHRIEATAYESSLGESAKVFLALNNSIDRTGVALFIAQTTFADTQESRKIPTLIRLAATRLDGRSTIERMLWRHGYR